MLRDKIIPYIGKLVRVFDEDDFDGWYCGWLALNKKTDKVCLGNGPNIIPTPIIENNYQIQLINCEDIRKIEEITLEEANSFHPASNLIKYTFPTWESWESFDKEFTSTFSKEDWHTGNGCQRHGYGTSGFEFL